MMMGQGKLGVVKWGWEWERSRGMCLGEWERQQEVKRVERVAVMLVIVVVVVGSRGGGG